MAQDLFLCKGKLVALREPGRETERARLLATPRRGVAPRAGGKLAGVAVIGAVFGADDPARAVKSILAALSAYR